MQPRIGETVIYRDHNELDLPAVVTVTQRSLDERSERAPDAQELQPRKIRELTDDEHVHLTVFGAYAEWSGGTANVKNIPPAGEVVERHTWRPDEQAVEVPPPASSPGKPEAAVRPAKPRSRARA